MAIPMCCIFLMVPTRLLPARRYVLRYNRYYDANADAQARKVTGTSGVVHLMRVNA